MELPNNNAVNMSNIFNENRDRMNRIIGANNRVNSNNYKAKGLTLTNQITSDKGLVTATETQDRSKEGLEAGAFAGSLNHIQDVYDKGAKVVKQISKFKADAQNVLNLGTHTISNPLRDTPSKSVGEVWSSELLPPGWETDKSAISKVSKVSEPVSTAGTTASTEGKVGDIISEGSTSSKVGKVLKGFNILTGGIDAYEDFKAHGIAGDNKLDKTSNVAGMISGGAEAGEVAGMGLSAGLELAGLGFDTSVIGAPVGAILGVAGLIAGGVSLLSGIAGDIEDEHTEKKQLSVDVDKSNANAQQETKQPQQKQQAFQSLSQQGQVASDILH
jgi:hypothetical protein